MSEADSDSKRSKSTWKVAWSNLPQDLLSRIANGLGLLEFLRFRVVFKEWHIASSKPTPEYKPSKRDLWFLMYGEGSQCSLLRIPENIYSFNIPDKIYTTNIPELDGATCLASYLGWLLLFRKGSMFFFCPFPGAKIELPNCPFTELSDHIAAFSSDPTSQDCIVAVVSRRSDEELELHLLCRGNNQWSKHHYACQRKILNTIRGAVFFEGEFHFLDRFTGLVTFDADKTKIWNKYRIVEDESVKDILNYYICKDMFEMVGMKKNLGLEGTNASISTCGTLTSGWCGKYDRVIQSESIESAPRSRSPGLKGVWIQPRYIQIAPGQSW